MSGRIWRTEKVRRPRALVGPDVRLLTTQLVTANPDCELDFVVAGNWRRGADFVGDLDLVGVTETGTLTADLLAAGVRLPTCVEWQRLGSKIAGGSMAALDGGDLRVDVWACTPPERGAFLLFAIGPANLNVYQRRLTARRGMSLSQVGVLDRKTKRQVDHGPEESIYSSLGLTFPAPTERQQWSKW